MDNQVMTICLVDLVKAWKVGSKRMISQNRVLIQVFIVFVFPTAVILNCNSLQNCDSQEKLLIMVDGVVPVVLKGQILENNSTVPIEGVMVRHRKPTSNEYDATISSATGYFELITEEGFWGEQFSNASGTYYEKLGFGQITVELAKDNYRNRTTTIETPVFINATLDDHLIYDFGEIKLEKTAPTEVR